MLLYRASVFPDPSGAHFSTNIQNNVTTLNLEVSTHHPGVVWTEIIHICCEIGLCLGAYTPRGVAILFLYQTRNNAPMPGSSFRRLLHVIQFDTVSIRDCRWRCSAVETVSRRASTAWYSVEQEAPFSMDFNVGKVSSCVDKLVEPKIWNISGHYPVQ